MTDDILEKFGGNIEIDFEEEMRVHILPYELHSQEFRPDICIGTDDFHTPKEVAEYFYNAFSKLGYKVGINNPFCGTIVPLKYYSKNNNIHSVMLEINRSLYMDEVTGEKNCNFSQIKQNILKVISNKVLCLL